jgi:protein-S-isoprenylcysteine O-methyltransferase Ste14
MVNPAASGYNSGGLGGEMITTILAYIIVVVYFLAERRLRKDEVSKSLHRGKHDLGSLFVYSYGWAISLMFLILAPFLNLIDAGRVEPQWLFGPLGVILAIFGLCLRYWAADTLGEFHTRTLMVKSNHSVVQTGPYKYIRHPGYTGILSLLIGSALATLNLAAVRAIPIIMIMVVLYRIYAEERMLKSELPDYAPYMKRTKRLIPFIF